MSVHTAYQRVPRQKLITNVYITNSSAPICAEPRLWNDKIAGCVGVTKWDG